MSRDFQHVCQERGTQGNLLCFQIRARPLEQGKQKAVLVGFGFAKHYDPDATTNALRQGSRGYAAPEQYLGGTNTRTDIYALAATLYSLLTGVLPADAFFRVMELEEKGRDPLAFASELVPDIPAPVARALHRALSIKTADRFESVDALWQAVKAPLPVHASMPSRDVSPAHARPSASVRQAGATPPAVFQQKWPSARHLRSIGISLFTMLMLLLCFSLVLGARPDHGKHGVSEAAPRVPAGHQMITPPSLQATPMGSVPSSTSQPTNGSPMSWQATLTVSIPSPTPQPASGSPASSQHGSSKNHGKSPKNQNAGRDDG